MTDPKKSTKSAGLKRLGWVLAIYGGIVVLGTFALYAFQFYGALSPEHSHWGTFGDYFGGVAGTLLGLLTLIVLVMALQIQSAELEETRKALRDQAESARQQVENLRLYEERRVQPLLRARWELREDCYQWILVNVGLGPCLLDTVAVSANGAQLAEKRFTDTDPRFQDAIFKQVDIALGEPDNNLRRQKAIPSSPSRVLAPGEEEMLVAVGRFADEEEDLTLALLDQRLIASIRFRSLAGVHLTTENQYDQLIRESGYTDLL